MKYLILLGLLASCGQSCPSIGYKFKYKQRVKFLSEFYNYPEVTIIEEKIHYVPNSCNTTGYIIQLDDGKLLSVSQNELILLEN